jgi:hypothetical protein
MTVPNDQSDITYTGTGATATYAYTNIKIFDEDDLEVSVTKLSDLTITPLAINTDYTVTGVGIAAGGNVVLVNASQAWLDGSGFLTSSYSITIKRVMEIIQETSVTSQGQNTPEYIEKQFDRSIMIDQQQQEQLDRCLKLPSTEAGTATNTTLPNVELRKNSIAAYDADGDPTTAVLSSVGANTTASFVTVSADASLPNRRVLTGTANQITLTDGGAGSTLTLAIPSPMSINTIAATTLKSSALTSGRVAIVGTSGVLEDDGGLTYDKSTDILTVPVVKMTPGAAPSLANGQQWSDSTQIAPAYRTGGTTEYGVRCLYVYNTLVTVANTVTPTVLTTGASLGSTALSANYLTVGKTLRFTARGSFNITGTPTLSLTFTTGNGPSCTSTITTIANSTVWSFEALIPIRLAGATGKAYGFSIFSGSVSGGASPFSSFDGGPSNEATVDTTAGSTIQFSVTWGTASSSNTFTCYHQKLEVLG